MWGAASLVPAYAASIAAMNPTTIQLIGAILFGLALIHTFSTRFFEHLAHTRPNHAGLWHFLAEVEVLFGFWALVLMVFMFAVLGKQEATEYLDTRNFTEPLFVFAIMVAAASRPVILLAGQITRLLTRDRKSTRLNSSHSQISYFFFFF